MAHSRFDKLGELLSEALDNGALPIQEQIANDGSAPPPGSKTSEKSKRFHCQPM